MATRALERPSRRYDPTETRARVLEAANALFSTKGYCATGTADIAREADVSEGSIFYHFGSKRNLLTALGRLYGERMVAAMHLQGEALEDVPPAVSIQRCFDYCEGHRDWQAIGQGINGDTDCEPSKHVHTPEADPFYRAAREVVMEWIGRSVEAAVKANGRTDIDVPTAASLTYAAVSAALDEAFAPGFDADTRARVCAETIRFVSAATHDIRVAPPRTLKEHSVCAGRKLANAVRTRLCS